ncbi:major facilitator superfamily domain-containing protein [Gloeopeniophorella convolvens]|nr:major facilitator superfamily domain-containing protein [Gloeopeniophorella convolvens]
MAEAWWHTTALSPVRENSGEYLQEPPLRDRDVAPAASGSGSPSPESLVSLVESAERASHHGSGVFEDDGDDTGAGSDGQGTPGSSSLALLLGGAVGDLDRASGATVRPSTKGALPGHAEGEEEHMPSASAGAPEDPGPGAQAGQGQGPPWWRRASPEWHIVPAALSALASAALLAPRLELMSTLVCAELYGPGPYVLSRAGGAAAPYPCAADPAAQARVAQALAVMRTGQGILGCLTAPRGLRMETRAGAHVCLARGMWVIVGTTLAGGLLGAPVAQIAAGHAYLADCTGPESRTQVMSLLWGMHFMGYAFGPHLAAQIYRISGSTTVIFAVSCAVHAAYALWFLFVVPESRTRAQMEAARRAQAERPWRKVAFAFAAPLKVLLPARPRISGDAGSGSPPLKPAPRDWSLTWLALACAIENLASGAIYYWYQYAAATYGWSTEALGYYISSRYIALGLFLAVILPRIFDFLRPKTALIRLPGGSAGALVLPHDAQTHVARGELALARVSLLLHAAAFVLLASAPSAAVFVLATVLAAFSSGFSPALNSIALEIHTRINGGVAESASVFSALGVIYAVGAYVVGSSLLGVVYMKTVGTFPEAMFYVLAACMMLSFICMCLVRIPKAPSLDAVGRGQADEEYIPGIADEEVEV